MQEYTTDIICQVLANVKSKEIIYAVLDKFIPNYELINLDYASKENQPNNHFESEDDMLNYFIQRKNIDQTFYWNKYNNNPHKIMVGAIITKDDKLIVSLTFNGTHETEAILYSELKDFLSSEIGIISYVNPSKYDTAEEFIQLWKDSKSLKKS